MICQNCGNELPEGSAVCMVCGNEVVVPEQVKAAVPGKTLGIVSLVLGILSILGTCCSCFGLPFPIAGAITGFMAMKQAKEAGEKNTFALIGLIASIVGFVGIIVMYILGFVLGFGMSFLPGAVPTTSTYYY